MNDPISPFHLAFPVHDLEAARQFYGGLLECPEGRSDTDWIDFNLFGHQIVAHRGRSTDQPNRHEENVAAVDGASTNDDGRVHNPVDGHDVPIPHFGVVLPWDRWHTLADRLRSANVPFVIEPYIRFEGQVGEQATMFFRDPSGNALEFKSFRDPDQLFAR